MSTLAARTAGLPRRPLAVLGLAIVIAIGGQVTTALRSDDGPAADPVDGGTPGLVDPLGAPVGGAASDLARIRANIEFWGGRAVADPRDFVSATRWAASEIELARGTGDVSRYLAADRAIDMALAAYPTYRPAIGYRGVVLVALHRFVEARDAASAVLATNADDPTAVATSGDANLELGDLRAARRAYEHLSVVADSAASRVRRSHLAFIDGDAAGAVDASLAAVAAAVDEGRTGGDLSWFRFQLGETLAATGDLPGAAASYEAALADDPTSHLARAGLARVAAAAGDWDVAIAHLDASLAMIPLPDLLARRADLYDLRGGEGDARRATADRATVIAIASLAGEAAGVYDRTLSLYLATTGEDPVRALALAEAEIAVRQDVYGYDALAWALLASGRVEEARTAMTSALEVGTRDAKLLYHAGRIELAAGAEAAARRYLTEALDLDPSFDSRAVADARALLAIGR